MMISQTKKVPCLQLLILLYINQVFSESNHEEALFFYDFCSESLKDDRIITCTDLNLENSDSPTIFVIDNLKEKPEIIIFLNSQLPKIPRYFFNIFDQLNEINLSNSGVKEFSVLSFWKIDPLKRLFLSNNEIEQLPDVGFSGAGNLTDLWLDFNKIVFVNEKSFQGIGELRLLSLQGNQIRILPDGVFNQLPKLEVLYIGENQLKSLDSNIFAENIVLSVIELKQNNLELLNEMTFSKQNSIAYLCLDENNLQKLNLNFNAIEVLFAKSNQLKEIFLNGTVINAYLQKNIIEHFHFQKIDSLELLDFNINMITDISNLSFAFSLKILHLSENRIHKINSDTFQYMLKLEYLYLRDCDIYEIDDDAFLLHSNLLLLDISSNHLKELRLEMIKPMANLKHLHINDNIYYCPALLNVMKYYILPKSLSYIKDELQPNTKEFNDEIYNENKNLTDDALMHISGIKCTNSLQYGFKDGQNITLNENEILQKRLKYLKYNLKTTVMYFDDKFSELVKEIQHLKTLLNLRYGVNESFWNMVVISPDTIYY